MLFYKRKTEKEFKKIFDREFDYATNYVFKMVRDKDITDDIVQKSFIKLFRNIKSFKGESSLRTYFTRILLNSTFDYTRSKKNFTGLEQLKERTKNRETDIWYLLNYLSKQQAECISLFYQGGFKVSEIATVMELSEASIKTHLSRARKKLKELLENG